MAHEQRSPAIGIITKANDGDGDVFVRKKGSIFSNESFGDVIEKV